MSEDERTNRTYVEDEKGRRVVPDLTTVPTHPDIEIPIVIQVAEEGE